MTDSISVLDSQTLAEFFNVIIPQQLEDRNIPGAAIAVVKDGEMIFAKGYGFADLEQKKPAIAEVTLFRTGSVAKLFTWTAVMQMVEQDQLDLQVNVNHYLNDFQIPDTFIEPITLEHLMTHTAGFEDGPMGMMRRHPDDLEPLGVFLARKIPARIYPPGQVAAYSNYGTTLASYIVEQVSGLSFEQYVLEHILSPLGMNNSTFYQPVPAALADDLATGYIYRDGNFQPQPFEIMQISPAGGASATVSDMARFMIAHLNEGRFGDARILNENTANLMHQTHYHNDPRLKGIAYGFYQLQVNDHVLLTHAGETGLFRSQLFLLPDKNLGLYIVYNAPGGGYARQELVQAFFDHFYPSKIVTIPELNPDTAQTSRQITGRYISSRRSETTIEKIRLLYEPLYQPITIKLSKDGYLESDHPLIRSQNPTSYQPARWVEAEPDLFIRTDGKDKLVFGKDAQANPVLYFDSVALRGYHKLTWFEQLLFQPLFPLGLLAIIFGGLVFVIFDKQALPGVRWLAVSTGAVTLAFLIGVATFAIWGFTSYLYGELSPIWWLVFALPVVLIFLTSGLAIFTLLPWPEATLLRHLPYALVVLAASGLLGWFGYWNLLGWRF